MLAAMSLRFIIGPQVHTRSIDFISKSFKKTYFTKFIAAETTVYITHQRSVIMYGGLGKM